MKNHHQFVLDLADELKKIAEISFPKVCTSCKARYDSLEDFLEGTRSVAGGGGLLTEVELEDKSVVDVIRTCRCGSTLMVAFSERRDVTPLGEHRRRVFAKLLNELVDSGYDSDHARQQLIEMSRGGRSELSPPEE